jgi:hypothetical protein
MHPILRRLIYGFVILFFASQALTILQLFNAPDYMFARWRSIAGLLALLGISAAVFQFKTQIMQSLLASWFFLGLISIFLGLSNPMHQYARVCHVNSDGSIESNEVYFRTAPIVTMLESKGNEASVGGERFVIGEYFYSPRIAVLKGESLRQETTFRDVLFRTSGIYAWLFGVRVACEQFAFFAINLAPLLIAYGLYRQWKNEPPFNSLELDPVRALFLIGPFVVGLIPLIEA